MFPFRHFPLIIICLLFTSFAYAGRPVDGTTYFNSVPTGIKASGDGTGAGVTASNIEGFDFNLTTAVSGPVMVIEVWDGAVFSGNGVAFYEQTSTINPLFSGIKITSNDGAIFDLMSIGINAQSSSGGNSTITITGLDFAGNPVSGASITGSASASGLTVVDVSSITAFKAIAGIRITSTNLVYAFIDNINLANVGTVLPLNLLDFSANDINSSVVLNWSTATEQNSKDFVVQQSINGKDWITVSTILAAGNSNSARAYSFVHSTPNNGANYYRLVQQDITGRQNYSNVIYINLKEKERHLAVYPSLASNGFINVKLTEKSTVAVLNSAGNVVMVKTLAPGVNQLFIGKLPAGAYWLKAGIETGSFVIQH